jgi:hypothetical protein
MVYIASYMEIVKIQGKSYSFHHFLSLKKNKQSQHTERVKMPSDKKHHFHVKNKSIIHFR